MSKVLCAIPVYWFFVVAVCANPVVRQSRQFVAIDSRLPTTVSPGQLKSEAGQDLVRLDADVLLLSAERIRETLLSELGLTADGNRIRLVLFAASSANHPIGFAATLYPEGWDYQLDIPDQVETTKLVRGIVNALLIELANRGQGPKSAELPIWLLEGLTFHLMSVAGDDLVVGEVPLGSMLRIVRERKGLDFLAVAREVLRRSPPLSFGELAYPKPETLTADSLKLFQRSAQLFVYELLHVKHGRSSLVIMLRTLPFCWNWETALLQAYRSEFSTMLDVEKQWSVDVLAFVSQEPSRVWTKAACMARLEQILLVNAQIRLMADILPERRTLTLQQVLTNWSFSDQAPVIRQKLPQLANLRLTSTPEIVPLIDEYQRSLIKYLEKRSLAARPPENRMQPVPLLTTVTQDALKELNALDQRRKSIDPREALTVRSTTNP